MLLKRLSWLSRFKLRTQALLVLLAGLVILGGVFSYIATTMTSSIERHEKAHQLEEAALAASFIDEHLSHIFALLNATALRLSSETAGSIGLKTILQDFQTSAPGWVGDVMLVDGRGRIVEQAVSPSPVPWGEAFAGQPFLQQLQSTGEPQVSSALPGSGGTVFMALAAPFARDGQTLALVAVVDVRLLAGVPDRDAANQVDVFLLDRKGLASIRQWPDKYVRFQDHLAGLESQVFSQPRGVGECYSCHDGKREQQLMGFVRLQTAPDWAAVTSSPTFEVLAPARTLQRQLILAGVIFIGLLILIAASGLTVISSRMRTLAHASRRIAEGDLSNAVPDMGSDEIGVLGRSFDTMRRSLKGQHETLEVQVSQRTRELTTLLDIDRSMTGDLPFDDMIGLSLEFTMDCLAADLGACHVLDNDNSLSVRVHRGATEEIVQALSRIKVGPDELRRSAFFRRPLTMGVSQIVPESLAAAARGAGVVGIASAPIVAGDNILGVLTLARRRAPLFGEQDLTILGSVAERMGILMERALLLRKTEEQATLVQQVMDTAPDAIVLLDTDKHIIQTNPRATDLLGLMQAGQTGDIPWNVLPPSISDLLADSPDSLTREIEINAESSITLELRAWRQKSGATRADWVLVIRDITAHKQMESALQENEQRYRMLFNSGNDMVMLHHLSDDGTPGRFIEVNDNTCRRL